MASNRGKQLLTLNSMYRKGLISASKYEAAARLLAGPQTPAITKEVYGGVPARAERPTRPDVRPPTPKSTAKKRPSVATAIIKPVRPKPPPKRAVPTRLGLRPTQPGVKRATPKPRSKKVIRRKLGSRSVEY